MRDIGAHAHHVDIDLLQEQNIVCQIQLGLPGQAHHHAGSNLIPAVPQCSETFLAYIETVISRMDPGIQRRIGGFNAQQVTVGSRFFPAAIGFLGLFPERERNAEFAACMF